MNIRFEGPAVFTADMAASRAFYEGVLGQEVLFAAAEAYVAYKSGMSLWEAAGAHQLVHGEPPQAAPGPQGKGNFELYFESEDLDGAWAVVQGSDAPPVHGLREMPWGQRCFRVQDPEGHLVEVAEPMPLVIKRLLDQGLSPEETAQRTMAPLEMVRAMTKG